MFLDAQALFSDAQALTASAASTNIMDLGVARNVFDGEPMAVLMTVDVAADTASGNETYAFSIQCDDNSGFSSATSLINAHAISGSALTLGSQHIIPIPVGQTVEQYLRVYYTLGGTTPSVTVTATLMPLSMISKRKFYADAITIS